MRDALMMWYVLSVHFGVYICIIEIYMLMGIIRILITSEGICAVEYSDCGIMSNKDIKNDQENRSNMREYRKELALSK